VSYFPARGGEGKFGQLARKAEKLAAIREAIV
jgi:hypothetical protein